MSLLSSLKPELCAAIAIDCLNTFMKADGELSISTFQANVKGLQQSQVQGELDVMSQKMGDLRRFLYDRKVPQIQFQDAHVIESIHGRRYHSLEIIRENEEPDFLRTFPPHALLEKNRRYGTPDQQAIDEINIAKSKKVFIRWFDASLPPEAILEPSRELIFLKDDFCMSPGSPFIDKLFWELRRQGRFYLIVFGVCDEVCNLRNVLLMLASIFNVIYIADCTYPLAPEKRDVAINYMQNFNPLGDGSTGQFEIATCQQVMDQFSQDFIMSHLKKRLCLIPMNDLTDCPGAIHHAIGSPHFDSLGAPKYPEPVVVAAKADIADTALPRCSILAVSCNTRPYQSYGPVMRTIFEKSEPHKYANVRRGMEGVMEVSSVRHINPGGLGEQTDTILLGCISPMTGKTNSKIVNEVLGMFAQELNNLAPGSTLRMPLIGTGKARSQAATDDLFKSTVNVTISHFLDVLIPKNKYIPIRRLILVHPFEYEVSLIASTFAEKSIFLTILDKLGIDGTDKRQVYGLAYGDKEENCIVETENFSSALDCFDQAIDCLLKGNLKQAKRLSSEGSMIDPSLKFIDMYISSLAARKKGLLDAIKMEALSCAQAGRLKDAYSIATALNHLNPGRKERDFVKSLKDCYIAYAVAATEARLLYEHYMETQEALEAVYRGVDITTSNTDLKATGSIPANLMEDIKPLKKVEEKISRRIIDNTTHIVVRKLMADEIELSGAKRALDNLFELHEHKKMTLPEEDEKACREMHELIEYIDRNKELIGSVSLRQTVLEKLLALLPKHGTLHLEAGRYYLCGKSSANSITRAEIVEAWSYFERGFYEQPRDYGLLSYMGLITFMQGAKFLIHAEEFFNLFAKLLDDELQNGRFAMHTLKSPNGEKIQIKHHDERCLLSYEYHEQYRENALIFARLAKALYDSEGTAAVSLYKEAIRTLSEIGRYDLAQLYDELLGETWVVLLCRNRRTFGSLNIPLIGEIPLDFLAVIYKKIKFYWRFNRLRTPKAHEVIKNCIRKMGESVRRSKQSNTSTQYSIVLEVEIQYV